MKLNGSFTYDELVEMIDIKTDKLNEDFDHTVIWTHSDEICAQSKI